MARNIAYGLRLTYAIIILFTVVTLTMTIYHDITVNTFEPEFFIYLGNRLYFIPGPLFLYGLLFGVLMKIYQLKPSLKNWEIKVIRYFVRFKAKKRKAIIMRLIIFLTIFLLIWPVISNYYTMTCNLKYVNSLFEMKENYDYVCATKVGSTLMLTFFPHMFALGLYAFMLVCLQMKFPVFHYIATSSIWRPLSKLALSIYCCSMPVAIYFYAGTQRTLYMTPSATAGIALGILVLSIFFGLIFYILIDKPIRNVEKNVLFPIRIKDLAKQTQKLAESNSEMKKEDNEEIFFMDDETQFREKSDSLYYGINRDNATSFNENLLNTSNYKRRALNESNNDSSSSFSVKLEESFDAGQIAVPLKKIATSPQNHKTKKDMKLDAISEKEEDENYDMVTAHNSVKGSVKGKKGFGFSIKKLSPAAKKDDDQSEFLKRVFEGVTETEQERKRTRPLTLYNNKLDESYGEIERVPEKRDSTPERPSKKYNINSSEESSIVTPSVRESKK